MIRLLLPLLLVGCAVDSPIESSVGGEISAAPLAADCAKGCSGPTPDETHPLSDTELSQHIIALSAEPVGAASLDLETLLFHGSATSAWLDRHPDALDLERRRFLRKELGRIEVRVEFRLVDEHGEIRGQASRVTPLGEKQHIALAGTGALKRIEINGKTKRVGLQHLWSRW